MITKKTVFSPSFSLVGQSVPVTQVIEVVPSVHHIIVIDVSGSMYSALDSLRTHLKNKLSTLVNENDTVSILWFSGKGQYGVIFEGVAVRTLSDLSKIHNAIDKWLQPVGLTGFKEPIDEVVSLIGRLKKTAPNHLVNFFFMTDGYDNQWTQNQIISSIEELSAHVDNSVFVEFGWGCNRPLMTKMAEASGGSLLFSEHFEEYETVFNQEIGRTLSGGKKVVVKLENSHKFDYAFSFTEDNIISYSINENGEVFVPETTGEVFYFSDSGSETVTSVFDIDTYVGLSTLSQRMLANEIFTVLGAMGDVYLVNRFVNSFSKQDYTDFQNECFAQGRQPLIRFKNGIDKNAVPKEDAFTILDVLAILSYDDENLIYPRHKEFGYNRIGSGSKQRDDTIKFEYKHGAEKGYPISGIVFNESRPNVSIRICYQGHVNLPEKRSEFPKLPEKIDTFIYRNYTIIRDGIVNTRKLPVSLTQKTIDVLRDAGIVGDVKEGELFVLDLSSVPVINRKMVKSVNAKETFTKVFELEKLKARQKVFKFYRDQVTPKKSEGYSIIYGEDAADWLKEIGITDYSGFNPPSDSIPFNDVYTSTEFNISVKGLSSLPSVNDVLKKIDAKKKLTLRESLLEGPINEVTSFINSQNTDDPVITEAIVKTWLETSSKAAIQKVRDLNTALSQVKFSVVVGHVWFNDLPVGEESMTLNIDGNEVTFNASIQEKEIGTST